jgi:hypothetical protein
MRRRLKSSQFELFREVRRSPEVPREVHQKMIRLLARLLREHIARKGNGHRALEANQE